MNKQEFLTRLRKGLSGLPQDEIEERLTFYDEMLEDKIEEGLSEEEAVMAAGPVEEIVEQVIADTPFTKIAKERIRPKKRLNAGEIILLVLGSPIWLSLIIAAISIVFAIYISLWAVIISLWAVFASLVVYAAGSIVSCIVFIVIGRGIPGVAVLATGMVSAGLSVFMFFGCKATTKGIFILTKKIALWIKNCFIKKEEA